MAGDKMHRNFMNVDVALFDGVGKYNFPQMAPYHLPDDADIDLVCFDYASTIRKHEGVGIHFYRDDYRFERIWRAPEYYTKMPSKFDLLLTPQFSMYTDYPLPIQLYNHYRTCWFGAYWQMLGLKVIPTMGWSDEASHEWCFDGIPVGGTVSVSSMGCHRDPVACDNFRKGYAAMMERIRPDKVLYYGTIMDGLPESNIVRYDIATRRRLREKK